MDQTDIAHLRRCLDLAREARATGNEPFGSLLVGADGTVLQELTNTVGNGDVTGHPELALAAWASRHLTPIERAGATLYTSCESCAMCAGGQYWAGIGRLVFALSGAQLADLVPGGRGAAAAEPGGVRPRQRADRRRGTVRRAGRRVGLRVRGVLVDSLGCGP